MEENDVDIVDVENYRGGKTEEFSHSAIVMSAMRKCLDAGCVEMRKGYITTKRDKFGNELPIYIPDTRLIFIECVETLRMVMGEDLDIETEKKLKMVDDDLEKIFNTYLNFQRKEWDTASLSVKNEWKRQNRFVIDDKLSQGFSYYDDYILDKVNRYREIYIVIGKRAKELNYWGEISYEA